MPVETLMYIELASYTRIVIYTSSFKSRENIQKKNMGQAVQF